MDGLILPGGLDVDPFFYKEEPLLQLGAVWREEVDLFQIALAQKAVERDMPLLGICRELQILNVALGGTLYQDIPTQCSSPLKRVQESPKYSASHKIVISSGTPLQKLFGESVMVNSFHHQAIKDLATSLKVCGRSSDNVIESAYKPDTLFCLGVQWHHEMMSAQKDPQQMMCLSQEFILKAQEKSLKR